MREKERERDLLRDFLHRTGSGRVGELNVIVPIQVKYQQSVADVMQEVKFLSLYASGIKYQTFQMCYS